jgi:long-subunit fatty acid transport protein
VRRALVAISALAALAAVTAFAPRARAGFEDSLGIGPEAMALGGSYAARTGSYAAAYYNPAGLSPRGEHGGLFELTVGAVYAHPVLHVTGAYGQNLLTPSAADGGAPIGVPDTGGILLGTRFSVGRPFKIDGLNFGLAMFVPGHFLSWINRPDEDIRWELLDDRTQVISIHAGLSYRINRFVSVGVGVRALFNTQTNVTGQVENVQFDSSTGQINVQTQLGVDSQVYGQATPIFGVLVTPTDRLRFGVVYRHPSYVNDWGTTVINGVPDLGAIGYFSHFAHYYEPLQVTIAASADLTPRLDVSADLTYERWSDAVSNNFNFWGPGRWGDTLVPAFGLRYRVTRGVALMAGYRFQKSPLDNFGGPSNMLDCDRHVASTGLDLNLGELMGDPTFAVHLTAGLQYTLLVTRTEAKDPSRFPTDTLFYGNPGYPSYSYGGHMIAAQTALEARW